MKGIFSLRRHGYLKTVSVFLIAVILIAGVVGCEGEAEYELTMAVNPAGGGTATDETGTSPYVRATVVNITAIADPCYRFVDWSATAGTLADPNAATTTFTMPAEDVTVTANFEPVPPDHYKLYEVDWKTAPYVGEVVQLTDQFGTFEAMVGDALYFGNPVKKVHGTGGMEIADDNRHYTFYQLLYEWEPQSWKVMVNNQFTDDVDVEVTVWGPVALAVPTQKEDHEMAECLDHLLVYDILLSGEPEAIGEVDLHDQFHDELAVTVYEPVGFANPVQKTAPGAAAPTPIEHEDEHYLFHPIDGEPFEESIQIQNQFHTEPEMLDLFGAKLLAVPSQKKSWEQPLNHFKTYWVDEMSPIGEVVQLEDQFVTITANVTWPHFFANPVEKQAGVEFSELSRIWDPRDHLMFYDIHILDGEPQMWEVVVDNQFGTGQWLLVSGPWMVIVPTEKSPHGPAEDLNHFLVYEVESWELTPYEDVLLWDQFTLEGPEFNTVDQPMLFAVPAHKTVLGGAPTPIIGDEHLLFYWIDGGMGDWMPIVYNQFFGPEPIFVYEGDGDWFPPFDLLGVPSVKVSSNPYIPD